jgi:uncharacterized protein YoxC
MLLTISITVIAASVLTIVIFLIPTVLQIRRTAREAEKTLETVRMEIPPLSRDITVISQEVKGILESVHRQVGRAEETITTLRDATVRVRQFEEEVLRIPCS